MIFLGKLNHLDLWGADIGNAYLEAFTDEKLYIVAGPEFQKLEGYANYFAKTPKMDSLSARHLIAKQLINNKHLHTGTMPQKHKKQGYIEHSLIMVLTEKYP